LVPQSSAVSVRLFFRELVVELRGDHGAKIVVLSRGMKECLEVPRETLDWQANSDVPEIHHGQSFLELNF
jgi:hypothetical protein